MKDIYAPQPYQIECVNNVFDKICNGYRRVSVLIPTGAGKTYIANSLQEYVCSTNGKKAGSYVYYASLIEHDTIPENIALLLEYNIPSSTIKKLLSVLPADLKDQELVDYIFDNKVYESDSLLAYEKQLVTRNLISSKNS